MYCKQLFSQCYIAMVSLIILTYFIGESGITLAQTIDAKSVVSAQKNYSQFFFYGLAQGLVSPIVKSDKVVADEITLDVEFEANVVHRLGMLLVPKDTDSIRYLSRCSSPDSLPTLQDRQGYGLPISASLGTPSGRHCRWPHHPLCQLGS